MALARMNMILHGNETNEIAQGNTLSDPKFRAGDSLATFDYLVANPPFSVKTWKNYLLQQASKQQAQMTPSERLAFRQKHFPLPPESL